MDAFCPWLHAQLVWPSLMILFLRISRLCKDTVRAMGLQERSAQLKLGQDTWRRWTVGTRGEGRWTVNTAPVSMSRGSEVHGNGSGDILYLAHAELGEEVWTGSEAGGSRARLASVWVSVRCAVCSSSAHAYTHPVFYVKFLLCTNVF